MPQYLASDTQTPIQPGGSMRFNPGDPRDNGQEWRNVSVVRIPDVQVTVILQDENNSVLSTTVLAIGNNGPIALPQANPALGLGQFAQGAIVNNGAGTIKASILWS